MSRLAVVCWGQAEMHFLARKGYPMYLEDETIWLQHRLQRMRTLLRFAKDPNIVAGLKELVADGEQRLDTLLENRATKLQR
jgi:hypothetical protein